MAKKEKKEVVAIKQKKKESFFRRNFYALAIFGFAFVLFINAIPNDYNLDDELVTRGHRLTSRGWDVVKFNFEEFNVDNLPNRSFGARLYYFMPEVLREPYYRDDMGYAYDYRPMVLASFAMEHELFAENPHVSHFINILLYACLCTVLFLLLSTLLKDIASPLLVFIACLFFAAHPLHTEVVCSIKNRDEILSLMFALLAFYSATKVAAGNFKWLPLLFLCFTCSLLSKYSGVSFAVIIPAALIILFRPSLSKTLAVGLVLAPPVFYLYPQAEVASKFQFAAFSLFSPLFFYFKVEWIKKPLFTTIQFIKSTSQTVHFWFVNTFSYREVVTDDPTSTVELTLKDVLQPVLTLYALIIVICTCYFVFYNLPHPFYAIYGLVGFLTVFSRKEALRYISTVIFISLSTVALATIGQPEAPYPHSLLMTTWLVLLLAGRSKLRYSSSLIVVLALPFPIIAAIQLLLIGGVEFAFPLIAFALSVAGRRRSPTFRRIGLFLFGAMVVFQLLLTFIAATEDYEFSNMLFQFSNLFCAGVILFMLFKPEKASRVSPVLPVLLFVFFLLEFNSFNFSALLPSKGNVLPPPPPPTGFVGDARAASYTDTSKPMEFQPFAIPTDRTIDFVESPVTLFDPLKDRIAFSAVVTYHYFKRLMVPYPMAFYYGYREFKPTKLLSFLAIAGLLVHGFLLGVFFWFYQKEKVLSLGLIIYLISISSVSGFLQQIAGVVGDRFALLPSLGFCLVLTWLLFQIFKMDIRRLNIQFSEIPKWGKASLLIVLLLYSAASFARNFQWENKLTLMSRDIEVVPESSQAHNLLALALMNKSFELTDMNAQRQMRMEALGHFKTALLIYPDFFNVSFDIGRTYTVLNMPDSALAAFKYAITVDSTFSEVHFNISEILMVQQRYSEAVPYLEYYIKDRPKQYAGYERLSLLYFKIKDYGKSIEVNRRAINEMPAFADPYLNISRTYVQLQQADSARFYAEKALLLSPNDMGIEQLLNSLPAK